MTTAHGELDAYTPDDPYYTQYEDLELPCGFLITPAGRVIFEYPGGGEYLTSKPD